MDALLDDFVDESDEPRELRAKVVKLTKSNFTTSVKSVAFVKCFWLEVGDD